MFTLIPPVEVNRQLPDLSFAAWSWYCQRVVNAGFQHAPTLVLHGTGAAHPAVAQLACALGACAIGPTMRNEAMSSTANGPDQRFMTDPLSQVGRIILRREERICPMPSSTRRAGDDLAAHRHRRHRRALAKRFGRISRGHEPARCVQAHRLVVRDDDPEGDVL